MVQNYIDKLISNSNLGVLLEKPIRIYGGLLNKMYKVTTSTGTYAVKYLNPEVMKRKDAKANHVLAEKIANIAKKKGITCLPAKIINNNILQEIEGNYFLIYDWSNATVITSKEITNEHVECVARVLGKLHNIDFGSIKDECENKQDINEIDWDFYLSRLENQKIKELIIENKEYLIELDKKATQNALELRNKLVISHRDLDLPNILWDVNKNAILIDWESAGLVNPTEEVIETAWDWSGGAKCFDINKFNYFIEIYKNNSGNLDDFNKALYSNFKNKSGWLEYNLKRVCRIECLDDEEQKLGEKEVIRVIDEILKFYKTMRGI